MVLSIPRLCLNCFIYSQALSCELIPFLVRLLDTGLEGQDNPAATKAQIVKAVKATCPWIVIKYDVNDRPWFRFGNGQWRQALSRVWISGKKFSLGIYVLDSKVLVLAGGDFLEDVGADVSYKNNTLRMSNYQNQTVQLDRVNSKHRMINIPQLFLQLENSNSE